MAHGRDPYINAALLGVLETVGDKGFEDLFDLRDVGIHDGGDRGIDVYYELNVLGFVMPEIGNEVVENRREHIVFVVADCLLTVDLGIVEDIADLLCDLASGIPNGDKIAFDLPVSGFVDAESRKTDDRVDRSP